MHNETKEASARENNDQNPAWVDAASYPFKPRFLETEHGLLHYIDEGQGEVIVLVHGTPTWSFLYRNIVKGLSARFRCVAVDNLGFGLSDKPTDGPYRPEDHARSLERLIETLELRNITLVVHDFGGPIGLSYAVHHPGNVKRVVLFNTWMWSLLDDPRARFIDKSLRGIGGFLYRRLNFSPRFLLPSLFIRRALLTPAIHRQYLAPFPTPETRFGLLALARALAGSSPWYDTLWQKREALRNIPALLLWGMKDVAFGPTDLERWQTVFAKSETIRFADAGHFVQEEVESETLNQAIERFLSADF